MVGGRISFHRKLTVESGICNDRDRFSPVIYFSKKLILRQFLCSHTPTSNEWFIIRTDDKLIAFEHPNTYCRRNKFGTKFAKHMEEVTSSMGFNAETSESLSDKSCMLILWWLRGYILMDNGSFLTGAEMLAWVFSTFHCSWKHFTLSL